MKERQGEGDDNCDTEISTWASWVKGEDIR